MTSFSQILNQETLQPRLGTRKINGGRKFSEIKVQKTWVLMFVLDWNLARYAGKTYCVRKCKKNGYREFDHRGTLTWKQKYTDTKNTMKTTNKQKEEKQSNTGKTDGNKKFDDKNYSKNVCIAKTNSSSTNKSWDKHVENNIQFR